MLNFKDGLAWLIFAVFFIVIGLVFLNATVNLVPISDSEYSTLKETNSLPIGAVSTSSLAFSQYSSVGFIIVGFCCLCSALSFLKQLP